MSGFGQGSGGMGQPPGGGGFGAPGGGGFGPPPGGGFGPPPGGGFGQPPGGGGFGPPPGGGGFGPPPGGGGFGPPPGQGSSGAGSLAVVSLVLAILGWFMCPLFSIGALVTAKMELGKISRGESSTQGEGLSKVAFWVAAANLGFYVLFACVYVGFVVLVLGVSAAGAR